MPKLRPESALAVRDEALPSISVVLVYLVCLVCLVAQDQLDDRNKPNEPDRPDRPSVLGLGLTDGFRLFSLEFGPAVIEPFRGCAGCVQCLGSFL